MSSGSFASATLIGRFGFGPTRGAGTHQGSRGSRWLITSSASPDVADAARQRSLRRHQMREHRPLGRGALVIGRDAALRRLDGDDTVAVRRPAQRAADVVAMRDRADAGRHRSTGAARRAAAGDMGSQGSASLCSGLSVKPRNENSGVLVRPTHDGPAFLRLRTTGASEGAMIFFCAVTPLGLGLALIIDVFLDRDRDAVQRAELGLVLSWALSAALAALSASSDRSTTTALSFGLTSRMRAIALRQPRPRKSPRSGWRPPSAAPTIATPVPWAGAPWRILVRSLSLSFRRWAGALLADLFAAFANCFFSCTVFFAICRPGAVAATLKTLRAESPDGQGFL